MLGWRREFLLRCGRRRDHGSLHLLFAYGDRDVPGRYVDGLPGHHLDVPRREVWALRLLSLPFSVLLDLVVLLADPLHGVREVREAGGPRIDVSVFPLTKNLDVAHLLDDVRSLLVGLFVSLTCRRVRQDDF